MSHRIYRIIISRIVAIFYYVSRINTCETEIRRLAIIESYKLLDKVAEFSDDLIPTTLQRIEDMSSFL